MEDWLMKNCPYCNKEHDKSGVFCSRMCASAGSKPLSPIQYTKYLIETGKLHELHEAVIRRRIKQYLISIYGHECAICGTTEWCGKPVPLVCDHIDGDSTNSDISNFRNVCCNCDAQLATFKSKNRGRGRKYDQQRYHKNKQED